jgi:hypothetical protein
MSLKRVFFLLTVACVALAVLRRPISDIDWRLSLHVFVFCHIDLLYLTGQEWLFFSTEVPPEPSKIRGAVSVFAGLIPGAASTIFIHLGLVWLIGTAWQAGWEYTERR